MWPLLTSPWYEEHCLSWEWLTCNLHSRLWCSHSALLEVLPVAASLIFEFSIPANTGWPGVSGTPHWMHVSSDLPVCVLAFKRQKRTPKQKTNARTAPKNFLNNSRALPIETSALRQIAQESWPESLAKSLSHKFFGVAFLPEFLSKTTTAHDPPTQISLTDAYWERLLNWMQPPQLHHHTEK